MATYVVIGGVAGGATAAARLRRMDESANVIVLERGKYVSFANCGLPYHIGGVISKRDALFVSTPERLKGEFNIDVRVEQEAVRIDRGAKQVEVRKMNTGETYLLHYDKLLLSPGARPLVPNLPGVQLPGVYSLRDVPDMDRIKAKVDAGALGSAVVVGGGFIGLEMAENLVRRGLQVTVIEMLDQVMPSLDPEMAAIIHRELRAKGVRLALGSGLEAIEPLAGNRLQVIMKNAKSCETDMVVLAMGIRPESELARQAKLDVGSRGHIVVNDLMQTSDPDIFAVGDAVQVLDSVTHTLSAVPLAGPANRQARAAADNMLGRNVRYQATLGTAIAQVFGLVVASTGANSRTLNQEGVDFLSAITHSQDHVGYYPGATMQAIKIFFTPKAGKLLGAQVVGQNAVDRTIDVLAVAIRAGMSVFDLEQLDLAYAPPYGSAKDPVNIAGYVAANWLRGDTKLIEWRDIAQLDPTKYGILDVRTDAEWLAGHIEGAVHIPNTQLRARIGELDRDKEWVIYCGVGRRAYVMERMLKQNGLRVVNLTGGWTTYRIATEEQSNLIPGSRSSHLPEPL